MLPIGSVLDNHTFGVSGGAIGAVNEFLFNDTSPKLRWLVVHTGNGMLGHKVLLHPLAIGRAGCGKQMLPARAQVENSPEIAHGAPGWRQIARRLCRPPGHMPSAGAPYAGGAAMMGSGDDTDPHVLSMAAVIGCHVQATDGAIGHVEKSLIDDQTWTTRYLIVDTKNWWFGNDVLIWTHAVWDVRRSGYEINTDLSRDQLKGSPPCDPAAVIDRYYQRRRRPRRLARLQAVVDAVSPPGHTAAGRA